MITKIISIQGIGRFENYKAPTGTDLGKMTLIYGDNGSGKTTLSDIFRSLCDGNSCYIEKRQTYGSDNEPYINIRVGSQNIIYKNNRWDSSLGNVEIFDSRFINDNIYSGSKVEHEHMKNLYNFVIGKEGVDKSNYVNHLDDKIRDINSKISTNSGLLKAYIDSVKNNFPHDNGIDISSFVQLENDKDIDMKIAINKKDIEELTKPQAIINKPSLNKLVLNELPIAQLNHLLNKTINNITEEAIEKTKLHIKNCNMNDESWIRKGLHYINNNTCPFCGEPLDNNELINAYSDYFNISYHKLKNDLEVFSGKLDSFFTKDDIQTIHKNIINNSNLIEFWQEFIQATSPHISFSDIEAIWYNISLSIKNHIDRKIASPLDIIDMDDQLKTLIRDYHQTLTNIASYNQLIESFNQKIDEKKKSMTSKNLQTLVKNLKYFELVKLRYDPEINEMCSQYLEYNKGNKT